MKPTTRKLDELGRLVLPRELREELGWRMESLCIKHAGSSVLLTAEHPRCALCGGCETLAEVSGKKSVEPVFGPFVNYSNNKERASA